MTSETIDMTITLPSRAPGAPSKLACEAATLFGLSLEDAQSLAPGAIDVSLASGAATLVVGRSGAGKTTLLKCADTELRRRNIRTIHPDRLKLRDAPIINLFRSALETSIRALARAGLAEPSLFARRPHELSEGQRARLRIALAMHKATREARAGHRCVLMLDEFGARLDASTTRAVCALLRRFLQREPHIRALVASPNGRLGRMLAPGCVIDLDRGRVSTDEAECAGAHSAPALRIERAEHSLYERFAHLHYRSACPRAPVLTLCASVEDGDPIGILVVCMPTLNAAWRERAWPGRYASGDRSRDARRLNAEVRRIARVIVDPAHRTLGVATSLVRRYLDEPLTERTEAVASMGAWSSFFVSAGMTRVDSPPAARHRALLSCLAAADIEPWRLAMPSAAWQRVRRAIDADELATALYRWANASRATRSLTNESPEYIFTQACKSIASPVSAFTYAA